MTRRTDQETIERITREFPKAYEKNRSMWARTAKELGINTSTLREIVEANPSLSLKRKEVETLVNEEVALFLLGLATGGEKAQAAAAIFWLKAREGWSDKVEHTVTNRSFAPPREEDKPKSMLTIVPRTGSDDD